MMVFKKKGGQVGDNTSMVGHQTSRLHLKFEFKTREQHHCIELIEATIPVLRTLGFVALVQEIEGFEGRWPARTEVL